MCWIIWRLESNLKITLHSQQTCCLSQHICCRKRIPAFIISRLGQFNGLLAGLLSSIFQKLNHPKFCCLNSQLRLISLHPLSLCRQECTIAIQQNLKPSSVWIWMQAPVLLRIHWYEYFTLIALPMMQPDFLTISRMFLREATGDG